MYRPAAFDMTEVAEIADFVDAARVAHLVTLNTITPNTVSPNETGLVSSVVPLLFDREANALVGHLARPNPQWRDLVDGVDALAIFAGVDAYVSPSFYPSKLETGKVVPTWNYEVVHATGQLVVHDDAGWVTQLVTRLTERHEAARAEPWSVDDTPEGFITAMVKGIVGIEIQGVRFEGKRKFSQNRSAADVDGVIAGLSGGTDGDRALAAAMRQAR